MYFEFDFQLIFNVFQLIIRIKMINAGHPG